MSDWTDLAASGRGRIVHLLEISGIPYVFADVHGWTPSDSWYTTRGYDGVKHWLKPEGLDLSETTRYIEGDLDHPGLSVTIVDIGGGMTAMLQDFAVRASSRLASDLTAAATTVEVLDPSVYPAGPDRAWLGLEAVEYDSISATSLTGCTRGALGTRARAYTVDHTAEPPIGIMVTDGPTDIRGRPCRVHVAVVDPVTGDPGATEVVFRGFVGQEITISKGEWQLQLEHCSMIFGRNVAQGLPETAVHPGYWYSGADLPGLASTRVRSCSELNPGGVVHGIPVFGWYGSPVELASAWNSVFAASAVNPRCDLGWSAESGKVLLRADAGVLYFAGIDVREGDPLWALGFDPGTLSQDLGVETFWEAQNKPRLLVVDWSYPEGTTANPTIAVDDESNFRAGLHAAIPGNAYAKISGTTAGRVELQLRSQDPARAANFWAVEEKAEDLVLKHVFALGADRSDPDTLADAVWRLLHLFEGQSEPAEWCAYGLTSDDMAFDELAAALEGAPLELQMVYDAITEPVSVKDYLAGRLGLLAVAPRITDEGKIGWTRLETPIELAASAVELDDEVWSQLDAIEVEARLGSEPLITQALIKFGYDYRDGKWGPDASVTWADGLAERGRVRAVTYDLRGLIVHESIAGLARSRLELMSIIAPWMTAVHYAFYGRTVAPLQVPCTWLAKQFKSGDVVLVTHPLLPDLPRGEIGMSARLGKVFGRKQAITSDEPDVLSIYVPPVTRASGIAPGALATSWDSGATTLTFGSADSPLFAADGANDLDDFAGGYKVLLWAYDMDPQPAGYPLAAEISSMGDGAVKMGGDPFGGSGLPITGAVWMTFCDWDDQGATQAQFLSISDSDYVLGTLDEAGFVWGA